ncbi:hypothetical protein F5877DRAFT_71468 [Lentinula edodes]|nr:hypothetical protein F5877DRAFT_71468 [Lentinula edodes]
MVHSRAVITTLLAVGTASVLAAPVPESFSNVVAARGPEDQPPPPGAFGQQPPQGPQGSHSPPSGYSGQEPQGGPPGALSQGPQSPAGSPGFHGPPHLGGQFGIPHGGPEGMRLPGAGMRGPGPHPPPGNMFPPGPPGGPPRGSDELQSPHPSHFGRRQMPGQQGPFQMGEHPQDPAGGPQGMQQGAPPPDMAGPGGPQPAHQPFGRPPQDHISKQQGEQGGHEGHSGQGPPGNNRMKPHTQGSPESQGGDNERGVLTIITMDTNMVRKTKDMEPREVNKKVFQTTLKDLEDHKDIEVDHPDHPADLMDMLVVLLTNRARILRKVSKVTATIIMDKVNRIKVTDTVAPLTPTMARTLIEGVLNQLKRSGVLGDVQYGSGTLFALLCECFLCHCRTYIEYRGWDPFQDKMDPPLSVGAIAGFQAVSNSQFPSLLLTSLQISLSVGRTRAYLYIKGGQPYPESPRAGLSKLQHPNENQQFQCSYTSFQFILQLRCTMGNALAARVAEGYSPVPAQSSPSDYVHRPRAEQGLSKEDEKMISYLESNGHTNDIDLPGLRLIIGMLKENPRDTKARSMLEQYYDHLTYMDQKGLSSTSKSS